MSTKAQIFQALLSGLSFGGVVANGYKVYFCTPGTAPAITSLKTIYLDAGKTTTAANPYTLDSDGRAELFLDGNYDVVVKTAVGGTVKASWENVAIAPDALTSFNVDVRSTAAGDVNIAVLAGNDADAYVRCIRKSVSDTDANYVILTPAAGTIMGLPEWRFNVAGESAWLIPIAADNDYLVK